MKFGKTTLYSAIAATVVIGAVAPAVAMTMQSWDPSSVAYSYDYYADAAKTEFLGSAYDTCDTSGVLRPNIPTPYYDQTPIFVCGPLGPYLPPDWPY
jgi:hypothetical protein